MNKLKQAALRGPPPRVEGVINGSIK